MGKRSKKSKNKPSSSVAITSTVYFAVMLFYMTDEESFLQEIGGIYVYEAVVVSDAGTST